MNYGLYLSAAGTLTNLHKLDVASNNLANLNTNGFKPNHVIARQRLPERLEGGIPIQPNLLLEQLGGGQFLQPTITDFKQGALTPTDRPLDVAFQGEGLFVLHGGGRDATGRAAPEDLRFTRDGQFTRDDAGYLVHAGTGLRVLDVDNQPIRIDGTGEIEIRNDGELRQDDRPVAHIQLAWPDDPQSLRKLGDNLFAFKVGVSGEIDSARGKIEQGFTENSAVDPIMALNELINVTKSMQANVKLMQYHDNVLGQAVNTFGRIA